MKVLSVIKLDYKNNYIESIYAVETFPFGCVTVWMV